MKLAQGPAVWEVPGKMSPCPSEVLPGLESCDGELAGSSYCQAAGPGHLSRLYVTSMDGELLHGHLGRAQQPGFLEQMSGYIA